MSEEEQEPESLEEKVEQHRSAILQIVDAWEEDHQKLKELAERQDRWEERIKRLEGCMVRMMAWKAEMKKEVRRTKDVAVMARSGLHVLDDRLKRVQEELKRVEAVILGAELVHEVMGSGTPSEEGEEEDPPSQ